MTRSLIITALWLTLPATSLAAPDGHGPPPGHHGPPAAEVAQLMEKVKERYPEKWEYLQKLQADNPKKFHDSLRKLRRHMMGQSSPEADARMLKIKELNVRFKKAVEVYKGAEDKDKDKLRKDLLSIASEMFNAKQEARKRRLEAAKKKITALETEIKNREAKRSELLEEFVDEATGDVLKGL